MTDTLTQEPTRIQAGDTLTWIKSLSDYLASDSWVLTYSLINSSANYNITSTASGSDHLVLATAADTALYEPGNYSLVGWVTKASERYSIYSGKVAVLPNLAAYASGYDNRSTARKVLDALDAAMLSHGSNAWIDSYEIEGRSMRFRSMSDFLSYRSKIQQEVLREENSERIRSGLKLKNKISVRF